MVILLIVLALLLFGAGFVVKWLFIAALVALLLAAFTHARRL